MKPVIYFCSLFLFILVLSCSKSDPIDKCSDSTFGVEFQAELKSISDAATLYGNSPTPANCNAFKSAYTNYVKALEDWEDCAKLANVSVDWKQAIDQARVSIADIKC
jgi:hypothetical protein